MNILKRAEKIALLRSLVTGTATPTQIENLRKSKEPMYITLDLGDERAPHTDPNEPTYHIEWYKDGTTFCYDLYPDGRKIERPKP